MSNRLKSMVGLLTYMTLMSFWFGAILSGVQTTTVFILAVIAFCGAQFIAYKLIQLIRSTE